MDSIVTNQMSLVVGIVESYYYMSHFARYIEYRDECGCVALESSETPSKST